MVIERDAPALEQHSLGRSVVLHLLPGAIFTVFVAVVASTLDSRGVEPVFVLFGSIGLVLVPLELGYLAVEARRTTGSWSPLAVVNFRERVSGKRLALLTAALATWFLAALIVSIVVLDEWLAENVFAWMPEVLRGFAVVDESDEEAAGAAIVAFLLIALAFNGIAGPVTEELYFRGHLLPRLQRYGRGAPIINTVLFAVYHFFSPWRYPAIIVGFLPITWMVWRMRSVYVGIAAHVTINLVTVLLILAAALASSD
jgi:membrane protease YdiL (CAAX protease family)